MKIEIPDELMEIIKKQITEYEKENQKPKDVIDYVNGYVITSGEIERVVFVSEYEVNYLHSIGLYRDTKEEAEKLLRKMQIEHRLRQLAKMCKEKVDWGNFKQLKHKLFYDIPNKKVRMGCTDTAMCDNVYFTDKRLLESAIEDIGEQNLIDNYFVEV